MRFIAGPSDNSDRSFTVLTYDGVRAAKVALRVSPAYGADKADVVMAEAAACLLAEAMSLDGGFERAMRVLRAEGIRQENEAEPSD